jgi:hypothetical protein
MDEIRNRGFKMFPDSTAARATSTPDGTEEPASDEVTARQEAFAHLTRGTHW